ncbi:hypothetical protein HDV03_000059 [Kappamyces sp. JEL0829]|nr:hypothetical protein HDV03_000059 [Kappamyces sp. JEL0829]
MKWETLVSVSVIYAATLSDFKADYGEGTFSITGNNLKMTLNKDAQGARLVANQASMKGMVCSTISTELSLGTAFSMYLSTGEPSDRTYEKWDELDFEFIKTIAPGTVWVNSFHDGTDLEHAKAVPGLGARSTGSDSVSGKRYCIYWDVVAAKQAIWTVDGQVLYSYSLQGWSKPLKPYFSYWGLSVSDRSPSTALVGWFGSRSPSDTGLLTATAENVVYSLSPTMPVLPAGNSSGTETSTLHSSAAPMVAQSTLGGYQTPSAIQHSAALSSWCQSPHTVAVVLALFMT